MKPHKLNQVSTIKRITFCTTTLLFLLFKTNHSLATGIAWFEVYSEPFSATTNISGGEASWKAIFTPQSSLGDLVGGLKGRQIDIEGINLSKGTFSTSRDTVSTITASGQATFGSFNEPAANYGPKTRTVAISCFKTKECNGIISANFENEDPFSSSTYTSFTEANEFGTIDKFGIINGKLKVVSNFGGASISGTVETSGTAKISYEYQLWAPSAKTQKNLNELSDVLRLTSYSVGLFGTSLDLGTIKSPKSLNEELLLFQTLVNGYGTGTSITKNPLADPVFSNEYAETLANTSLNFLVSTFNPATYKNPAALPSLAASGISLITSLGAVGLSYLASDPPDANFKVLLTDNTNDIYQIDQFTTDAGKSVGIVNNKLFQFAESLRLATSSLEKYQGAMLANDFEYATLQLNNFKTFEAQYKALMSELPQDILNAKSELFSLGLLSDKPDFTKLTSLIRELQTNPESLESFKQFLAIYSPGTTIDDNSLTNLNVDELITLLTQEYQLKSFDAEFDNLAYAFLELNNGYSNIANPSAVPVPAALPLMVSALVAFGVLRRRQKVS